MLRTRLKLSLLACLLSTSAHPITANETHYAIIVDAGSSGSRLHLFQISGDKNMPQIKEIFSESTKPGLSSYASHPSDAGASLKKLLDDASAQLAQDHIDLNKVPVSVLATAGMRLLTEETQAAIYADVSHYINTQTTYALGEIETISGKMEGLYGWLDVNYLKNTFQSGAATVGSIDLGGASTQIAFATNDTSKTADEINITLNHRSYTVFTKSFLGLGQDQALANILNHATANSCYPSGYTDTKVIPGTFNFTQCTALYDEVIQSKNVATQLIPLSETVFVAYSGVYYDLAFFGVTQTTDEATVENQIQSTCSQTWAQLHNTYPNDKYLSGYCANASYVSELLYKTYHLKGSQLLITAKINQHDIDWTLGALLYNLAKNTP